MTAAPAASAEPVAPSAFHVLVVGAGAVGQIYADATARGGARVTFYVREHYREETARGFTLVKLGWRGRRTAHRFEGFGVVSSVAEVAALRFDQVYLAIPSTGLGEPWLGELIAAIREATLVNLTPSAGDRERILAAGMHPDRLVDGFISIVSYPAPLPGERSRDGGDVPEGTTVWGPPGSPNLFSGPRERVDPVVAALRAGGLPARLVRDVPARTAFMSSALMAILLGLEEAGWSVDRLRRTGLPLALAGAREAMRVTAHTFGAPPLGMRLALWSPISRLVMRLAPRLTPFPLEPYLRYHFTKVGAQTRHILGVAIERGRAAGLPVSAMEQLLAAAPPVAGAPATAPAA
jgi:hypothetical protein